MKNRDKDVKYMKRLLPDHYTCKQRKNGVHCYSNIGIDENDSEQWKYTMMAMRQHFGVRFDSVFHQTCTNHLKFTVFLHDYDIIHNDCGKRIELCECKNPKVVPI